MKQLNAGIKARVYAILLMSGILLVLNTTISSAQEYGLGFAGQPNSKDRRSGLDLNPDNFFSLGKEFELSFHMRMRSEYIGTFGYVFRIADINGNNIDLVFNGPKSNSLQIVCSNKLNDIQVQHHDSSLYQNWTEIKLKLNLIDNTFTFSTSDTVFTESNMPLSTKVKIFFGRNNYNQIKTTDVPNMDIKDIIISKNGKRISHFPLDELEGNQANNLTSNNKAITQFPMWIRPKYYNWEEHVPTRLSGFATVCYVPGEEKIYLVGEEQMKIFSLQSDSIQTINYDDTFTGLIQGSQIIYDTINKRLICYNLKNKSIYNFNFPGLKWDRISYGQENPNRLRYHNKYYSNSDSILYILGGYGQHRYSNQVLRYTFRHYEWDTLQTYGDILHPRMHSALGVLGDTLYIIGGFGSTSGDQILNPHHYTDLLAFSMKDYTFVKKYDYQYSNSDLDFAHSMVFDKDDNSYYVLASSIFQYESNLVLLKGSLSNPELKSMGERIPYLFHNENSYSDLFYSKKLSRLFALTSLADTKANETQIKIFTMAYPPYPTIEEESKIQSLLKDKLWILIPLMIVVVVFLFWRYFVKATREVKFGSKPKKTLSKQKEIDLDSMSSINSKKPANSFFFFGGFQVFNHTGDDITRKFTPLLKELFLLIFLFSIKDKGISVSRLTELLWFSMSPKSAKNNRAVNIAKLKNLLNEVEGCGLTRKTEYWKILFDESKVYSDYFNYYKLTHQKETLKENDLESLLSVTNAGPLLGNASYEWLDEFKLECSNQITDVLMKYLDQDKVTSEPELLVRIADAILIFDIMHEEAISIKCRALIELGKHSLSKEIFNKFTRDFLTLYDEPYDKSFTDIIKDN